MKHPYADNGTPKNESCQVLHVCGVVALSQPSTQSETAGPSRAETDQHRLGSDR